MLLSLVGFYRSACHALYSFINAHVISGIENRTVVCSF